MHRDLKTVLVVAFIFIMIATTFQAIQFMTEGQVVKQVMLEQFANPKRASDCKCLPGFIPSNSSKKGMTTTFFCQSLSKPGETKACY